MIEYVQGDIFKSETQTIVNTVNCVGAMGAGIALEFKKQFPNMYLSYKKICDQKQLKPGLLHLYKKEERWILNFPTKDHFKDPSTLEYIEKGLIKFKETYKEKGITSISFPKLGCGKGGLDFNNVKPLMEKYLNLDIKVKIYI